MKEGASICIVRLSALGDVTHVVPVIRRIQETRPDLRLSWVVGSTEYQVVSGLPEVQFLQYRKADGLRGLNALRHQLPARFDAVLIMQVSLRAGLVSTVIRGDRRIGFDAKRSRDAHGIFINERIDVGHAWHVADVFQHFADRLEIPETPLRWDLPVSDDAKRFAEEQLGTAPTLIISPCSSHPLRNWTATRYAAIADYASQRHGLQVVLCGGNTQVEKQMEAEILNASSTPIASTMGKDTLPRLLGLLQRAHLVLTPDSGPAHLANAVGTSVIGLHAATNPRRSGPYRSQALCVDRFDDAVRQFGRGDTARWGYKIEKPGVMDLIKIDDVIEKLDLAAGAGGAR